MKNLREESVKSLYDSKPESPCPLCGLSWARGDAISKWLGDWVHESCKAARAASRATEGVRTELPPARGGADRPRQVGIKAIRQSGISRTRQLS